MMKTGTVFYVLHLMIQLCYLQPLKPAMSNPELHCFRTESAFGLSQCSFLQKCSRAEAFFEFYLFVWTKEQLIQECYMSSDPEVIDKYLLSCSKDSSLHLEKTPSQRHFVTLLLESKNLCKPFSSSLHNLRWMNWNFDLGYQVQAKTRKKRAWTAPGTLWCGVGSKAADYEQLGLFEQVDRCCREHDHCDYIIPPYTVNFGIFNPSLFTISHCDCDHRFKQCLLSINDTVSNVVGYTFFNILKINCFNLIQKKRCTQINWFGLCRSIQVAPFAILKNPTAYNTTTSVSAITKLSGNHANHSITGKQKIYKSKKRKHLKTKKRYISNGK